MTTPVISPDGMEAILVGGELVLNIHSEARCHGGPCCIHNPSQHRMSTWRQHWQGDIGIVVRVCAHDFAHPDPDDLRGYRVGHVCDGCCHVT